jgi:hypothetical protein
MHLNTYDPAPAGLGKLDRSAEPIGAASGTVDPRAAQLADTMREILFRDGNVTETALLAEGFTAGEIVEHAEDARRHANLSLVVTGNGCDTVADVITKAIEARAFTMPITAGTAVRPELWTAWRAYCRAVAAHKLDAWVSQSERCVALLNAFLELQPLSLRYRNQVVLEIAVTLKNRVKP